MKIFATRVWGFGGTWPIITFNRGGDRDNLLRKSAPGDLIVFVGTLNEPTLAPDRGRILGMAEISRIEVETEAVLDPSVIEPHDYDESGKLRWPKALLMVRAWKFEPRPLLKDVLSAQLPYNATSQAVQLSDQDRDAILALPFVEIELPESQLRTRLQNLNDALMAGRSHGPTPSDSSGAMNRSSDQVGFTYAFRFGKSDAWKIGRTVDVRGRLADLNKNIPTHVTGQNWEVALQHKWPDLHKAHDMEQRVLDQLEGHTIGGEMVRCSEAYVEKAWANALFG